jgi:hypothetical protein
VAPVSATTVDGVEWIAGGEEASDDVVGIFMLDLLVWL